MRTDAHPYRTLFSIVVAGGACLLAAGCSSSNTRKYDSLDAQTSRAGWVVGDSLGMSLSEQNHTVAVASRRSAAIRAASVGTVASHSQSDE